MSKLVGCYTADERTRKVTPRGEYYLGTGASGEPVAIKVTLDTVAAHVMRGRLGNVQHIKPPLSNLIEAVRKERVSC